MTTARCTRESSYSKRLWSQPAPSAPYRSSATVCAAIAGAAPTRCRAYAGADLYLGRVRLPRRWCRLGGGGWSLVDGRPEPIPFVVGEVFDHEGFALGKGLDASE